MAKNKNRKHAARQQRSAPAGAQQVKSPVAGAAPDVPGSAAGDSPGGHRAKQRRFGHN